MQQRARLGARVEAVPRWTNDCPPARRYAFLTLDWCWAGYRRGTGDCGDELGALLIEADLPKAQTDQYNDHQEKAFLEAFNNVYKEYRGDERRAFARCP